MAEKPCITFIWKIENFNQCTHLPGESLESPQFYVNSLSMSTWELHVYPNCFENDDKVKVFLYCSSTKSPWYMDYEISFLSVDGYVLVDGREENVKIEASSSYQIATYPSREEILKSKVDEFLPKNTLTIRCRIWDSKKMMMFNFLEYCARTRIGMQQRILHWALEEFRGFKVNEREDTHRLLMNQSTFSLKVGLKGKSIDKAYVDMKIERLNNNIPKLFATCKISVLDKEKRAVKSIMDAFWFKTENCVWKFPKFLTRNELISKKSGCLVNGKLNLLFDFTFSTGDVHSSIESIASLKPWLQGCIASTLNTVDVTPSSTLDSVHGPVDDQSSRESSGILELDLLSLYKDGSLSDFELRSGDAAFHAHRLVLAHRSPVFKAMFTSGMREGNDSFLDISDVDGDTLRRLLLFIYTGNVEKMEWPNASKLYYAADKYDLSFLKQKCSAFLKANITVNNVCEILVLSDRHRDEELKTLVYDFMVLNDENFIRSDEWRRFMEGNIQLASETMYQMYSKKLDMMKLQVNK